MRLVMTVLLFVVLPTALLSVLAGHSIQSRELILERRLVETAEDHLDDTAEWVEQVIEAALKDVMQRFRETVLAGTDVRRLTGDLTKRNGTPDVVRCEFLYMNPWGYVYPETSTTNAAAEIALRLQPFLAQAIGQGTYPIRLRTGDGIFYFQPMPGHDGLFAGIALDLPTLARLLNQRLDTHSTSIFRFSVLPDGTTAWQKLAASTVQVHDNLEMAPARASEDIPAPPSRQDALVIRPLPPPLDLIELAAFAVNLAETRRAHILQIRLIRWGVLLLGVVISVSAVIVIDTARRQVATARRRSEFVVGMSHDLRTPLAALRMMAESLLAGRVTDEQRRSEFLHAIVTECDRLADLIERVMFYFRQQQGALRYQKHPLDLAKVVSGVVERFHRQQARLAITFTPEPVAVLINGDADAMEKVLTNLIDNAIKYGQSPVSMVSSEAGLKGATTQVDIGISRRPGWRCTWVVLSVRDHGHGIVEREHRRIFDRFYRGQAAMHAHRGGFGLGLSLVAGIVNAHRGRIKVRNAPDGGAVFEVWLKAMVP